MPGVFPLSFLASPSHLWPPPLMFMSKDRTVSIFVTGRAHHGGVGQHHLQAGTAEWDGLRGAVCCRALLPFPLTGLAGGGGGSWTGPLGVFDAWLAGFFDWAAGRVRRLAGGLLGLGRWAYSMPGWRAAWTGPLGVFDAWLAGFID